MEQLPNDSTQEATSVYSESTQKINEGRTVVLIPVENDEEFTVSKELAKMVSIIDTNRFRCDVGIKKASLVLIIEYCEHHNYIPPPAIIRPLQYNDFEKCISDKWDFEFINKIDIRTCFELANDCDSVKCESLFGLCCAKIGHYFRCSSTEELKKSFGLTANNFTKEEAEDIRKGNQWLMDMIN